MTEPVLRIEGLTVTYRNGFSAIHDMRLELTDGDAVAIVGESGCGKSTTIRAILDLLPATANVTGELALGGERLDQLPARARRAGLRKVGFVSQDPYSAYDPLRTVRHHVLEPLRINKSAIDEPRIIDQLQAASIADPERRWRQYPHQWSGGMLQRAEIIASTLLDPLVTLADEPTSALDADLADGMMRLLRERSRALLFVTHDVELAARHADRIIVMERGRVVETGQSADVLGNPQHAVTQGVVSAVARRATRRAAAESERQHDESVVTVDSVVKSYDVRGTARPVLQGLSLQVTAGEIVGVCGPSGAGKSTMLRILGGLEQADSGAVRFAGGDGDGPDVMPVFQDPVASLDPRWPLWRIITEPLLGQRSERQTKKRLFRRSNAVPTRDAMPSGDGSSIGDAVPTREQRRRIAREALDSVGLAAIDVYAVPGQLSVGQCQRVAIARALCATPRLIIADEPTASLDVTTGSDIVELLRDAARTREIAMVVVSHDVALLRMLADQVMRLEHGVLRQLPAAEIDDLLSRATIQSARTATSSGPR